MSQPLDDLSAERIGRVLLALETQPVAGFDIIPLATAGRPRVIVRLSMVDHPLSPAEARLAARIIADDGPFPCSNIIAQALRDQAAEAEALASHLAATHPNPEISHHA